MKRTNYRTGLTAEAQCRLVLRLKGYSIVASRYRAPQCERLARGANDFLARHPHFNRYYLRFDVMLVTPWRWPAHIADAWRPEGR